MQRPIRSGRNIERMVVGHVSLVQHASFSDLDYIWCTLRFLPAHCDP